jgi:Transglutaminase-like superfamily
MVMEAWVLLWACRIGLWFTPFPRVLAGVQYCASRWRSARALAPSQAVEAIRRALRLSWHASCLTQALAGWIMLTRHGVESRVQIGVSSPARHGFRAHAWLETGGRVILGDDEPHSLELNEFQVIWTLPRD